MMMCRTQGIMTHGGLRNTNQTSANTATNMMMLWLIE